MPPKKVFLWQVDNASRNIHDDLLELLPKPANEYAKMKKLFYMNLRLKIEDGLYDRGNLVRDDTTTK